MPLIASSNMPGTLAVPNFVPGTSAMVLGGASYWPGPGRQSRLRLRSLAALAASALVLRPLRCSSSWSLSARSVSIRSELLVMCSFSSVRLWWSTRSILLFCSRTSMRWRCCSSLCSCLLFWSSSRRAWPCMIFWSRPCSLLWASCLRSASSCSVLSFVRSNLSLKAAALSLLITAFSSRNLSIRSSSASSCRACAICFSLKSSSILATSSALWFSRSSNFCLVLPPFSAKCCSEAALRISRVVSRSMN
mmetsp:Transcript_52707/g.153285  ORF Transcript_52707/g.153285 Transcript_52707/m.153285 type:complete len:249 (+) Transcript_52707:505-1251(+)